MDFPTNLDDPCLVYQGAAQARIDARSEVGDPGATVTSVGSVSGRHGCSNADCATTEVIDLSFRLTVPNGGSYRVDGSLGASGAARSGIRGAEGARSEISVGNERLAAVPRCGAETPECRGTAEVAFRGQIPRGGEVQVTIRTAFDTDPVFTCCSGSATHDVTVTIFPFACGAFASAGTAFQGTDGDDVICGGPGDDVILAGAGNDVVHGGGGNDQIAGDEGADQIDGGPGADRVFGGPGNDFIYGGDFGTTHDLSSNILDGGEGSDQIYGGDFEDDIRGGPDEASSTDPDRDFIDGGGGGVGRNQIVGGRGDDVIFAGDAGSVFGGLGDDTIYGGPGADTVNGGAGNDTLHGFEGDDFLFGADGDDLIFGGSGDDVLAGGNGSDRLNAENYPGPAYSGPVPDADGSLVAYSVRAHAGEVVPGGGRDDLQGEQGLDFLFADDPFGSADPADVLNGGPDVDLCRFDRGAILVIDSTAADTASECDILI